jgi:hypothetical protein
MMNVTSTSLQHMQSMTQTRYIHSTAGSMVQLHNGAAAFATAIYGQVCVGQVLNGAGPGATDQSFSMLLLNGASIPHTC